MLKTDLINISKQGYLNAIVEKSRTSKITFSSKR